MTDDAPRPGAAASPQDLPFAESVGYQVRMTNRAFQQRLRERIAPYGVSSGMWYFLRLLWREDGLTQRELSRAIGLMEPTAVTALASMERAGLIRRVKHPTDRRKINVFLTDAGQSLKARMLPIAREINAEGLAGLTRDEVAALLGLLKRIEAELTRNSRTPRAS